MSNIKEQRLLSNYLKGYGLSPENLERLIAAIFKTRYPDLVQGSPGGGRDLGMDILHIHSGNKGTVWCIATTGIKDIRSKLYDDAISVMRSFRQWNLSELATIYLCTCQKLSNIFWRDIRNAILEEKGILEKQGITGLSKLNVIKYDCNSIALDLTSSDFLKSEKENLQRDIVKGLGLSLRDLQNIGSSLTDSDDIDEDTDDIHDELEDEKGNWQNLYTETISKYSGLDNIKNESIILEGIRHVERLVNASKMMSYSMREQELPKLLDNLNKHLWPNILASLEADSVLSQFDVRLAACALYVNLILKQRTFSFNMDLLQKAHHFIIDNANNMRLLHNLIIYKLITLLLWLNHRFSRYHEVLEMKNIANQFFITKDDKLISIEGHTLLINLACLYIQAIKYNDGDRVYRTELAASFDTALLDLEEGFWKKSLSLMRLLYERRSSIKWALAREQFIKDFELIDLMQVNTNRKAIIYIDLYSKYLELIDVRDIEAIEKKLDCLTTLMKQVPYDVRLRAYKLFLELGACSEISLNNLPNRFLSLERLILKESIKLGSIWATIVRTRMLKLFLFRIMDQKVLNNTNLLQHSKILLHLLDSSKTKSLRLFFGIPEFKLIISEAEKYDEAKYVRSATRPLINYCLSSYTNIVLANYSLPAGLVAKTTLEYLDFLTYANALYPDIRISVVFSDALRLMEDNAKNTPFFHYLLARLYYKYYMRNIAKAVEHFNSFWSYANDFEKNRFAGEYARALYEHHIYIESELAEQNSLNRLLEVGKSYLEVGSKKHFVSCYYGLALILKNNDNKEADFLNNLVLTIKRLANRSFRDKPNYYEDLISNTVYSSFFHNYLKSYDSYISNALLTSLNSPEIYNTIATFLLRIKRPHLKSEDLVNIKILYDIAIGLTRGQDYYLPKYEFNRIRCDFFEIEIKGSIRDKINFDMMVSIIDNLHKISPKFPWARRFLQNEVSQYLHTHRKDNFVHNLLNHYKLEKYWRILRIALKKRL